MRLLITRPEEDGSRLAERLAKLGHEPVLLPLLTIGFPELPPLELGGVQALIATSRNALRGLARNTAFAAAKALPIYCVGEATAAMAAESGFTDIREGPGTARELAPAIAATAQADGGALLYLTGEQIAFDLAGALGEAGFDIRRVVVYKAEANREAGPAVAAQLKAGLDGALLMSPRTAQIFAALWRELPARSTRDLTCYCYSQSVADALEEADGLRVAIAARPLEADLLALIGMGRSDALPPG
jgi:uroporphyrinogen-III synthase